MLGRAAEDAARADGVRSVLVVGVMQRWFGWSASGVRPVPTGEWHMGVEGHVASSPEGLRCAGSPLGAGWERLRVAAIASELTREVAHSPASPRGSSLASVDGRGPRGTG